MDIKLKIVLLSLVIIFMIFVLYFVRKNKMNIKYSFIWLAAGIVMAVSVLIPGFLVTIQKLLGFETLTNMLYVVGIFVLLFITFSLTMIVSTQNKKIRLLIQEVSIFKKNKK